MHIKIIREYTYLGSSVHHIHKVGLWIRLSNGFQHNFILITPSTKSTQRLRTSTYWSFVWMQVGESWKSSLRAKLWTGHQYWRWRFHWHINLFGIGVAEVVLVVDCGQVPPLVRHMHPFEFRFQIVVIPASTFLQIFGSWIVIEAVQIRDFNWNRKEEAHMNQMNDLISANKRYYLWQKLIILQIN